MKGKKLLGIVLSLATVMSTLVAPLSADAAVFTPESTVLTENFDSKALGTITSIGGNNVQENANITVADDGTGNQALRYEIESSEVALTIPFNITLEEGKYLISMDVWPENDSKYFDRFMVPITAASKTLTWFQIAKNQWCPKWIGYGSETAISDFSTYSKVQTLIDFDASTATFYVNDTQIATDTLHASGGMTALWFVGQNSSSYNGTGATDGNGVYWFDNLSVQKVTVGTDPEPEPDPTPTPTEFIEDFDDLAIGAAYGTAENDITATVANSPVTGAGKALKLELGTGSSKFTIDYGALDLTAGKKYNISYKLYPESYPSRIAGNAPYIYGESTYLVGGQITGTTFYPLYYDESGSAGSGIDLATWAGSHPNEYITVENIITLGAASGSAYKCIVNGTTYTEELWGTDSTIDRMHFQFSSSSAATTLWIDDVSVTEYVAPTSYSEDFEGMEIGDAWTAATESGSGDKTNTAKVIDHNGNKALEINLNSQNAYKVLFDFSDLALEDGKDYKVSYKIYPKNPGTRKINQTYLYNHASLAIGASGFAGGYTIDITQNTPNLMYAPMYYTGSGWPTVDFTNWAVNNPDEYVEVEYVVTQGAPTDTKYICYVNGIKYTSQAAGQHTWGATDIKSFGIEWGGNSSVDPTNPEIYYIDDVKVRQAADIDDIILTDTSDNEISSLTGLTSVKAAVTLTVPIDNYVIIAAVLDGDGNLKAVTPHTATASSSENMTISIPTGANDNWNIKFMIWDGFTNIKPLVEPVMRPKNMVNLYVNPASSEGGDGSYDLPFNTITAARDSARAVDKTKNNVTVHLADGYYTEGTLAFTGEDTNTKFVATGNHAVIANATQKPLSSFTTTTNTKVPSSVRSNVKEITLTPAEVGTYQAPTLSGHGADELPDNVFTELGITKSVNRSIPIITFGETLGVLARYPNTDYMSITKIGDIKSNTDTGEVTRTRVQSSETVSGRWNASQLSGAMIGGFFNHDWSDQYMPIHTLENGNTIVTQLPSAFGEKVGGKFYVYNLLEELDAPGEWFFDATTSKLYVYPPTGATSVNISISNNLDAIQITNSKNLTFDGITVEGATGNGIEIANTDGITIKNCTVMNSAQYGIYAEAMNENLLISACTVEDMGGVGIRVNGGDRTTLTSWNNKIENCIAHDFGMYERAYSAGIDIKGVGVNVTGCEIYNSPHVALRISGNDHRVLSNKIHDAMLGGAKDMGAIYMGRSLTGRGTIIDNNEIYNVGTSVPSSSEEYSTINGPYAVYLDDLQCGYTITNNRIHDIKGSGVFINGGRDNKVNNNTFNNISLSCVRITNFGMPAPNGGNGAGFDPTVAESKNRFDLKDEYMTDIYFNKYPNLENILSDNPTWPKYNDISNNTWGSNYGKQIYWNGNSATDTTYYTAKWQEADFRNKGQNTSSGNG